MNGFIRFMILSAMIATLASCASQPTQSEDGAPLGDDLDAPIESSANPEQAAAIDGSSESSSNVTKNQAAAENKAADDFADLEQPSQEAPAQAAPQAAVADKDLSIEDEVSQAEGQTTPPPAPVQEQAQTPPPAPAPVEVAPTEDPFAAGGISDAPAPQPQVAAPTPETTPVPAPAPMAETGAPATITDLKFKANETGGTVIVEGNQPLNYKTRMNADLHQYVVEVENAILPDRLKRSLNTRDIKGAVGAIDAYQNPGSTTARFVIQMRDGVSEPAVQVEGNSLLIVASGMPASAPAAAVATGSASSSSEPGTAVGVAMESHAGHESSQAGGESLEAKILPGQNLSEFLAGNTQFYGKKISIETNNMDIRDALNFITEESGVNMVLTDEVKGNISLKLRQVPWDQALVVIMRARKLGYTRQGNVLRISPLADLKAEEDDANKLATASKSLEPLKVRMFPVSYAKVDELEKKIKDFLSERGKAVGDLRTSSIVVTDTEDNLDRVGKLIANLDTQPQQVLIEGKIVEAAEDFTRSVGVNWGVSGMPIKVGNSGNGPVNMTPRFDVNRGVGVTGTNFSFGLDVGTLDVFGSISAALALNENENKVKVLASPRIYTMSNEKADITQTTEVPVKKILVQPNIGASTTFEFKPLTLKLEVTPQVTADGSVIMKVQVKREFQGAIVDANLGSFSVNSREANTRVLVKNGQTAVIGGIYQSDATDGETGVPWLREIPVVGWLFKSKNVRKIKSELLIFLTPRITGQSEGSANKEI